KELERKNKLAKLKDLPKPLAIEKYAVTRSEDQYGRKFAKLLLRVKNKGNKRVTAYKLTIEVKTKLGSNYGTLQLTSESSSIEPLEFSLDEYSFEDNQFIQGEIYDKLAATSTENLVLKLVDQIVVKD